jgi:protein-disulfide isomerase
MQRSSVTLAAAGLAAAVSLASLGISLRVRHELAAWAESPVLVSPEAVKAALLADPKMLLDAGRKLQEQASEDKRIASMQLVDAAAAELAQTTAGFLGNEHGKHVLTEFYDSQCPHCRDAEPALAKAVKADPELKVVLRNIPILGDGSVLAARLELAAASQGLFMKMHDAMMSAPVPITREIAIEAARGVGADMTKLDADIGSEAITKTLNDNISLSRRIGLTGTPGFAMPGRGLLEGFTTDQALEGFLTGKKPS